MYEFEFWDEEAQEYVYLYGHSLNGLEDRYPKVDFSKLKFVAKYYID